MDIRPEVVGDQAKKAGLSFWQHNKSHIITGAVVAVIVLAAAIRWLQ
jgi:hypothetical protein